MPANRNPHHFPKILIWATAVLAWLAIWYSSPNPAAIAVEYWEFFLLGLTGAIAANSTGAGGGVVFIPAFNALDVPEVQMLATSIAIQCFGMTAGSISWLSSIQRAEHGGKQVISLTSKLILLAGSSAITGMLLAQHALPQPGFSVTTLFRYFSIFFGLALLYVTLRKHTHTHTVYHLRNVHLALVCVVSLAGGIVTSWISVGAGEWLAILLFFIGCPTMVIVCVAVCVSSLTVLSGLPYHLLITEAINWNILILAAPAALAGGSIARLLSERLGPVRLKIFFATWILATGLAMS